MDYRLKKQLTIIAVILIFLVLLGAGIYFFLLKPEPTCFDNKKNQGEIEIDCGGPCVPCEIYTVKDIETVWVKTIRSNGNLYDIVAKVRNPNPNFGTANFVYKFEIKGQDGQIIGTRQGSTFILPDEIKYLIEINFESEKPVASANLIIEKVEKNNWQQLKDYQAPKIFVSDKNFRNQTGLEYFAEASGMIRNETSFDFSKVFVSVVVFDRNQEVIGVSKTEASSVLSGEGRYFSTKWFYKIRGEVGSVDMQAETNLFLDENYMKKFGVSKEEQQ